MKVVTYHKSWTYSPPGSACARSATSSSSPASRADPKHLAELIVQMKAEGVRALLIESFYNRSIAGQVADAAGAKLLVLPSDVGATPKITSYVALVDAVLDALLAAK